jgi:hypothetical protein
VPLWRVKAGGGVASGGRSDSRGRYGGVRCAVYADPASEIFARTAGVPEGRRQDTLRDTAGLS